MQRGPWDKVPVEESYLFANTKSSLLVKSGAGILHTLTISQDDAAPTAGTIDVYDSLSATGTKIFSWTLQTTTFVPFSLVLDIKFATGCFINFTTTADVNVVASFI